jgi:hypothetical protein
MRTAEICVGKDRYSAYSGTLGSWRPNKSTKQLMRVTFFETPNENS